MFLRAVSVLSPVPFNERLHSNLLRLAVHDELLGVSVLDVDVVGVERRCCQRSAFPRRAPRTCPLQRHLGELVLVGNLLVNFVLNPSFLFHFTSLHRVHN
jgi:hypothetical protein